MWKVGVISKKYNVVICKFHEFMARLWNETLKNDSQPPSSMSSTLKPEKVKYSISLTASDGQVT